jgi:hypothetical protein
VRGVTVCYAAGMSAKPSTAGVHTTTIRVPEDMRAEFKALCDEEGRTVSSDLRRYMRDRLREANAAKQKPDRSA